MCIDRGSSYLLVPEYLEEFSTHRDMVKHCGGQIGGNPGLVDSVLRDMGVSLAREYN
jgi:hypothetical protein